MNKLENKIREDLITFSTREYRSLLDNQDYLGAVKNVSINLMNAVAYVEAGPKNFDKKKEFMSKQIDENFLDLDLRARLLAEQPYIDLSDARRMGDHTLSAFKKEYPNADLSAIEKSVNSLYNVLETKNTIVQEYAAIARKKGITNAFTEESERLVMKKIFVPATYADHLLNENIVPNRMMLTYMEELKSHKGNDDTLKELYISLWRAVEQLDGVNRKLNGEKVRKKAISIFY